MKILEGKQVPEEITLNSRLFTPDNIDEGGEWLTQPEEEKNHSIATGPRAKSRNRLLIKTFYG